MPQTTVTQSPERAKEGLLYDAQGSPDGLVTALVDETNGIRPGRLVVRSSAGDWTGELPAGAATLDKNVLGVSCFSHKTLALDPRSTDNELYEDGASMPVARQRRMWVRFEDAFDPTDSVFVRVAANGAADKIGGFRTDADDPGSGATAVAWAAARILSSGAAGELGLIEINI